MYKEDSEKEVILEVDLEYLKEVHKLHSDYLLAAEQVKGTDNVLLKKCQKIKNKYGISVGQVHKLMPTVTK